MSQGSNEVQNGQKNEIVRATTCTFMHGFQNHFAQSLSEEKKCHLKYFFT